jgi:hypothetical protein
MIATTTSLPLIASCMAVKPGTPVGQSAVLDQDQGLSADDQAVQASAYTPTIEAMSVMIAAVSVTAASSTSHFVSRVRRSCCSRARRSRRCASSAASRTSSRVSTAAARRAAVSRMRVPDTSAKADIAAAEETNTRQSSLTSSPLIARTISDAPRDERSVACSCHQQQKHLQGVDVRLEPLNAGHRVGAQ